MFNCVTGPPQPAQSMQCAGTMDPWPWVGHVMALNWRGQAASCQAGQGVHQDHTGTLCCILFMLSLFVCLHLNHPEVCFSIWPTVTGKCPDPSLVIAAEVILTEAALWLGHLPAQGPDRLLTPRVLDSCTEGEMEAVVRELGRELEQDLSLWAVPGTPPEISNFSKQPGKKYRTTMHLQMQIRPVGWSTWSSARHCRQIRRWWHCGRISSVGTHSRSSTLHDARG
jgi:hypothetical protein